MKKYSEIKIIPCGTELVDQSINEESGINLNIEKCMPIMIIIDLSCSIKAHIEAIHRSVIELEGLNDRISAYIDMCVIDSRDNKIVCAKRFSSKKAILDSQDKAIIRSVGYERCSTISPIGIMMNIGYKKLKARAECYSASGKAVASPTIIVYSDFKPNDFSRTNAFETKAEWMEVFQNINTAIDNHELNLIKVVCGKTDNNDTLQKNWINLLKGDSIDLISSKMLPDLLADIYQKNSSVKPRSSTINNDNVRNLIEELGLNNRE